MPGPNPKLTPTIRRLVRRDAQARASVAGGGSQLLETAQHDIESAAHTGRDSLDQGWTLIAGGVLSPTSGATPTGEILPQVKTTTGAPTHSATEGQLCWVAPDDKLYVSLGAGDWQEVGAAPEDRDFGGALTPAATISATKDAGNPTFAFDAAPESIVKVGETYWCSYQGNNAGVTDARLAYATDRDGPWTAYSGNPIYEIGDVPWGAGTVVYAPFLMEDDGTFYLFYSVVSAGGANAGIGVATATTVTGPYTDHGSAILSPGAGAAWDSLRVGESDVIHHDGRWVMAYMGETTAAAYQASEKIGTAVADSPVGPWTKSAANPVIDFGPSGAWDDALCADPSLFFENGYYWIMYAGAIDAGPSTQAEQGLAYALDPTGPFTRYPGNPVLTVGAGGSWEDVWVFRGAILLEEGLYSGVYAGFDGANYKGGNFRLTVDLGALLAGATTAGIWRPLLDGAGAIITDGTGQAVMAFGPA